MKRIIIILLFCLSAFKGVTQFNFPSTDSLHRYTNRFITNSAINAFTDYRMNTLLNGIINWIDTARLGTSGSVGVDTIYALNDSTIRYRKNSVNYTFNLRGNRWTLQQVLNHSSVLISNNTITLADSLIFTSGKTVIDNLRITSASVANDTTSNKPAALDANGNVVKLVGWPGAASPGGSNTQIQYKKAGAFAGDAGLTYNDTTNTVTTDSLQAKRLHVDTVRLGITKNTATKKAYFFGTSITNGYYTQDAAGGFDTTRRWTTYVCRSLGWQEINLGIPGEVLQSRSPVVTNMIDNGIPAIPTYNSATDTALFLEFGINDCTKTGQGLTNYSTANFITDYGTVTTAAISSKGWPASLIHIIGSNYIDTIQNTNNSYTNQLAYFNATKTAATNAGVDFIDVFTNSFINRNSFFYSDMLHPSNTGHSIYSIKVLQALGESVVKNGQTLAANGITELQQLKIKQTDTTNVNYQVVGVDQYNHAIKIPNGYFIENNPLTIQYGGINLNGFQKLYSNSLGTNPQSNSGLLLLNTTAAINGGQQYSPKLHFRGNYWNTGSSASKPIEFKFEIQPIQGTGGSNLFLLRAAQDSGSYSNLLDISKDGTSIKISEANSSLTTLAVGAGDLRMNVNGAFDMYGQNVINLRYGSGSSFRYTMTASSLFGTNDIIMQGVPSGSSGYNVFESVGAAGIALSTQGGSFPILFATNRVEKIRIDGNGKMGIGTASPTAFLHLKAGTATANTAPLKLNAGTNLTTPEDGAIEYDGAHYYATISSTRYQLDQQNTGNLTGSPVKMLLHIVADADYTVGANDYSVVYTTATATRTLTLPSAGSNTNRIIIIANNTANTPGVNDLTLGTAIKFSPSSTTTVVTAGQRYAIQSDGTDWWVILSI